MIAADVGASSEESEPSASDSKRKQTQQQRTGRRRRRHSKDRQDRPDSSGKSSQHNFAPKKRVVSDGHWRKNRSPPSTPTAKAAPRKRNEMIDKYGDTRDWLKEESGLQLNKRGNGADDGINVYAGPLRSPKRKTESRNSGRGSSGDDIEAGHPSHRRSPNTRRTSPKRNLKPDYRVNDKYQRKNQAGQRNRSPKGNNADTADLAKPDKKQTSPPKPKAPEQRTRPAKGNILTQVLDDSKKMFAKPEPSPPEKPPGSRVENWLSNTSDTFADADASTDTLTAPDSAPSYREHERGDAKHHNRSPPTKETAKGRRRDSKPDPRHHEPSDEESHINKNIPSSHDAPSSVSGVESTESTPKLKRSKAKKRKSGPPDARRMSTLRESVEEAIQGSSRERPLSSDGSEVSAERPLPLSLKRPFPTTGMQRLSTIMSVDSQSTARDSLKESEARSDGGSNIRVEDDGVSESETRDKFDMNSLPGPAHPLKRRLTKHADLISVLSFPTSGNRSIRSARSIRTNRSRLATATVGDIMQELASDELKYMRELRTLVGGVIPVLLTSILSKADSAIAAGLFRPSMKPDDDANFSKPIIDMGISLEKLKSLHKRIPLDNSDSLLAWATSAQKVYADYLAAWRLGFQDVVVNLAPPDADESKGSASDTQSLCAGMDQDENGDVINGDGERVDVAFLLKRPLVRLKYLTKTFKGLNYVQHSSKAEEVASLYQSLVTSARRRANEERARLEDEAAASIDATRARDLQTLAVLKNVSVDGTRKVTSRDFFNFSLLHSTGQQIDCRAELLLRENSHDKGPGGDLLISEVDETGRWLLFPPIECSRISARNGDSKGEIVIMIRSELGNANSWYELLSFTTSDEQIGFEWVQLVGLNPVPPKINRSMSFLHRVKERKGQQASYPDDSDLTTLSRRAPSPSDLNVPIGEHATVVNSVTSSQDDTPAESLFSPSTPRRDSRNRASSDLGANDQSGHTPRNLNEAMDMAGDVSPTPLRRNKAQRRSKYGQLSPLSPVSPGFVSPEKESPRSQIPTDSKSEQHSRGYSPTTPTRDMTPIGSPLKRPAVPGARSLGRRSLSPVPSLELPTIPKLRKNSHKILPAPSQESLGMSDTSSSWPEDSHDPEDKGYEGTFDTSPLSSDEECDGEGPPIPPPHRTPSPASRKQLKSPVFSPPTPQYARHRRTSSPLKHEYEPSTTTESSSSEYSSVKHYETEYPSDTSDEELEDDEISTPLPPVKQRAPSKTASPPSSPTEETRIPSSSRSPTSNKRATSPPSQVSETVASIYFWHEKGSWEPLHTEECSIIITPGLIEAYELSPSGRNSSASGNEQPRPRAKSPIVGLELTPLVPIRRGTAVDISIRSPPTAKSRMITGNNIMFRSHSPDECDKLYGFINQSRINNPTYIALQNTTTPFPNQPETSSHYGSARNGKFGSWFSWNGGSARSSYRATNNAPPASLGGATESSVGTMSSAFSALKRFGAGSKMFSIARSTLTSRTGSRDTSIYSTSSRPGSRSSHASNPDGIGLSNTKIRLYHRESASKWRDLGAARLTILPASPVPSRPGTSSNTTSGTTAIDGASADSSGASADTFLPQAPAPVTGASRDEKRILIRGKSKGQILLDAVLGESCFERVARTGIAVSVWEDFDGIAKEGGVVGGSFKVYMIQMKSEAETAYTFGLVGKLRY